MKQPLLTVWLCVLLSAVFMSVPWLVPHCGFFALFGLVPLLCADHIASVNGVRRFRIWHYSCFVLWNALTTWWIANATVGGAVFAVLANSLQMSLVWGLFRLGKKSLKGVLPYILLAAVWIAWEWWYMHEAEISWPWLVLGNAFAQSTRSIQWYEYTGVLGGSAWVWAVNLTVFFAIRYVLEGEWARWKMGLKAVALLWMLAVAGLPYAVSAQLFRNYEEKSEAQLNVLIGQPNFDPYEKFEKYTQKDQNTILLAQLDAALGSDSTWTGLLLAPETFTSDVVLNDITLGDTWQSFHSFLQSYPNANLLFGASAYRYYFQDGGKAPDILARKTSFGWRTNYNVAMLTDASGRSEVFKKSKLVVGTELTPYPRIFVPIDNLIGEYMGRCQGQKEITCLHFRSGELSFPFGSAVCYESVYGDYCTGYIRKGAKLLTVITNDAWWGNTPGYKQHLSYSRLRAIETRRDIARCGNTGISAIIDQRGEVLKRGSWWERETLSGTVNLNSSRTFYSRNGDWVGLASIALAILLAIVWIAALLKKK